jgi:pimeloyl-ACP methyl ester carboxylesterase
MNRPRLLLVPMLTEIEWAIKPLLEEWADVASFDAPGVGEEPPMAEPISTAVAKRAITELERRGWERAVVVADEFGVAAATELAAMRPGAVEALALGHARLSNDTEGRRPAMNGEVYAACAALVRHDLRTFLHQMFKMTQGEAMTGGYGDDLAEGFYRRVPADLMTEFYEGRQEAGSGIGASLDSLDVPLLLAKHEGCLMFTTEGFDDAIRRFPDAIRLATVDKPSMSPEFADALREFCGSLAAQAHEHGAAGSRSAS